METGHTYARKLPGYSFRVSQLSSQGRNGMVVITRGKKMVYDM